MMSKPEVSKPDVPLAKDVPAPEAPGVAEATDTVVSDQAAPDTEAKAGSGMVWVAFGSILLAELGDKTQLATMLLSAKSHSPIATFVGASLALILTSLLGVLAGQWIAKRISPALLNWLAGGGFVIIGGSILWQALQDWSV
ncbi:MAG: TMEM165/GDT1 family protein [Synechococcaceae cyanobacterium SM2_3_60]|nr:TMEM165/GDT1 family protein [Synechococcaceae cyanobacterium SM2_3_60]